MRRRSLIIALAVAVPLGGIFAPCHAQDSDPKEADRLAALLNWQQGSVVGDIGAGDGQMTRAAAKRVGTAGRVYSTEIDAKKLLHLQKLADREKNITAIKAAEAETNLPQECCDCIFMRLVYHHLTKPAEIDASLFRSLKPGGLLAVIDREPPVGSSRVEGVPENRIGHGVPQKVLIKELTSAGFQVQKVYDDWPDKNYCVVFHKPSN
jgi:ubiquinone/menaquinone biosynthesis C-methylase UbiE